MSLDATAAACVPALRRLLAPGPTAQIVALGSEASVAALCRAAWGADVGISMPRASADTRRYDLAVAYDPPAEELTPARLRGLSAQLAAGARLVAVNPRASGRLLPWPALELALAEAAFCIEQDERVGAGALLVARPTALTVRAGEVTDEAAIRALFARVFHHDPGRAHWLWRYAHRPGERPRVSVALDEHGAVLGHWGADVADFEVHDGGAPVRVFRAHHNGDVMTAPVARRLGRGANAVLARVARHFWACFGERQAAVHYGFNTATARAFSLRFVPGVRRFEDVQVWGCTWPVAQPRSGLRARLARWRDLRVERVTRFGAEWDAFYRRVAPAYGVLARRDAQRLAWRYGARPGHEYQVFAARRGRRLQGWAVLRQQRDTTGAIQLEWGDVLVDPAVPGVTAALLEAAAFATLGSAGQVSIAGWFPARPAWWVAELRALGFEPAAHAQGLALVGALFEPAFEPYWLRAYYTQGDSDLF